MGLKGSWVKGLVSRLALFGAGETLKMWGLVDVVML